MSVRISDFIEASNAATTFDGLGACYAGAIASYGYDRYMYAMMSYDPAQEWHDVPSIMRNYPEDWMKFYIENGYVAIDPLRQVAFRARGPVLWDSVPELIELSAEQRSCLFQGTEAGLFNGIGVPIRGRRMLQAGIGLASSAPHDGAEAYRDLLAAFCNQFYLAFKRLYAHTATPPDSKPLSPKETEILTWVAGGKTDDDIAAILGISRNTVDTHMRSIFRKLDAGNRVTAVVRALMHGHIHP
jgi:DNA-binding CsgD family transcriptional regulator